MATLGPGRQPIVMSHYPHFLLEDTLVWTKFLESKSFQPKEVWYDVRVGEPVILPVGADSLEQRVAAGLTRKRIDVVAAVAGGYWVIEVKPYASMLAVGQILTYARLFGLEYTVSGEIVPVIVCDEYDRDLLDAFDDWGVLVIRNS